MSGKVGSSFSHGKRSLSESFPQDTELFYSCCYWKYGSKM